MAKKRLNWSDFRLQCDAIFYIAVRLVLWAALVVTAATFIVHNFLIPWVQ